MYSDATAAIAISRRLGQERAGTWMCLRRIQSQARGKNIDLQKVLGSQNPSDALTKPLSGQQLREHGAAWPHLCKWSGCLGSATVTILAYDYDRIFYNQRRGHAASVDENNTFLYHGENVTNTFGYNVH